ncbi:hypothetical protein EC973_005776 [Apophysomyces ossiformis]|uniref:Methyltransferase domain-containing protein n=1 Tax=Apophysomyces ossiformis TaxID=679940 RepID=A0A8H7BK18_9FUNG|nr:hypothetical protein EC973_005776 [Apophysomyces ossiformis]
MIDGRKYQTINTKYCLPVDEIEQDRLINTHYMLKHCFGSNYSAPIEGLLSHRILTCTSNSSYNSNSDASSVKSSSCFSSSTCCSLSSAWGRHTVPPRVLDLCCGSGTWVLDMATEFPHAEVYGVDFVPIYPTAIKPANAFFCKSNVLQSLPFSDSFFDYVHMRLVYNCFSNSDRKILMLSVWQFILEEIKRVLKPGGYIELREINPIIQNPGPTASTFFASFVKDMKRFHNVDVMWSAGLEQALSCFGPTTSAQVSVALGKEGALGESMQRSIKDTMESYRRFFVRSKRLGPNEYDKILEIILEEGQNHESYFTYHTCWARKPLLSSELVLG